MIWAPVLALSMFIVALLIVVIEATMHDRRRKSVRAVDEARAAALLSQWRHGMSKLDGAKEELGWLKVVFALLVAIDASLVAWIAQTDHGANHALVSLAIIVAVLITAAVAWVNHLAYRGIRELKEL